MFQRKRDLFIVHYSIESQWNLWDGFCHVLSPKQQQLALWAEKMT